MADKKKPLSLAERRLARLAKQVAAPTAPAQPKVRLDSAPKQETVPEKGEVEEMGCSIIAMLESPSEDAMPRKAVEEMFNSHELKVVWANEDHSWNDFQHATVLVTVKRRVDDALLATLPRLRLVAVAFTGYDHVDLEACKKRGVAVANVPGYSTDGAAELCFGLIFSLLRHIPMAHQHVRAGKWNWPPGNELCGRRFGIIGTGEIGLRVAEISKAFRVSKIIGFDPIKNEKFVAIGGEYVQSLATIFLHSVGASGHHHHLLQLDACHKGHGEPKDVEAASARLHSDQLCSRCHHRPGHDDPDVDGRPLPCGLGCLRGPRR